MANENKNHSLGIDAIFQYSGAIARALSGLLFYVVIDRLFSTTTVGAVALLLAIVGLFNAVFSLGLGPASEHFISVYLGEKDRGSAGKTIRRIIFLTFIASLMGASVVYAFSLPISEFLFHSPVYAFYVKITSVVLFSTLLFEIFNQILLGLQKFRESALIGVITWISYYSVAILLAFSARSLLEVIVGWIIGMSVGMVSELLLITHSILSFPREGTLPKNRVFYRFLIPVLFSTLLGYGSFYIDRLIVAGLLPLSQLGIYNFVLLFGSTMMLITAPFNNILMPKFSELFGRGERESIRGYVNGSILLLSFLYVPISLGVAAVSPVLLGVLGGPQYVNGSIPLMVIMFFSALSSPIFVLTQAVESVRKTYVFLVTGPIPLASNIAISIILIPRIGLVGAALGFSSVNLVALAIMVYFTGKERLASFDLPGMLKIWAASIATFALTYSFSYFTGNNAILLPLYIFVGLLVYIGLIRILRAISGNNRKFISALFPSHNVFYRFFASILNLDEGKPGSG